MNNKDFLLFAAIMFGFFVAMLFAPFLFKIFALIAGATSVFLFICAIRGGAFRNTLFIMSLSSGLVSYFCAKIGGAL